MAENTYTPVRDSSLSYIFQTSNYGASANVQMGLVYGGGVKGEMFRAIADFDVSDLGGETVLEAELVRYIYDIVGEGGFGAVIRRCTRPGAWVEGEVTWLKYDAVHSWTTQGGDYDNTPGALFVSYAEALFSEVGWFTVTGLGPLVQDAIDNRGGILSIVMRSGDEGAGEDEKAVWYSKESMVNVWSLVVRYGEQVVGPAERRVTHELPALGEGRPARAATAAGGAQAAAPAPGTRSAKGARA